MGIKSNRSTEEEVIQEIGFDSRLEGAHIAVTVEDGIVMLTRHRIRLCEKACGARGGASRRRRSGRRQ
jgi:hypothetical protein